MMLTGAKRIIHDLRIEMVLAKPDFNDVVRLVADALELLDQRIDDLESESPLPSGPEVRHGDPPEVRGRRKK